MNLKEIIKTDADLYGAIIGTLFADGSVSKIRNRYKNCCCDFTHTAIHLDYLKMKAELFEMIPNVKTRISQHNKKTPEKTYELFRMQTTCNEYFTEIEHRIYDKNRVKLFPIEEIRKMTDFGLFLMYLDDGCLKAKYKEGSLKLKECRVEFALCSFTLNEILSFENWLENKYGIKSRHYRIHYINDTDRGYIVWMNSSETKKFMNIIDKFYNLIPSFNYKFLKSRLP